MKKSTKFLASLKGLLVFLLVEIKKITIFVIVLLLVGKILLGIDVNGLLFGTSRLVVFTDPGGADIYINGEHEGRSPTKKGYGADIQLFGGKYTVEAILPSDGPMEEYAIKQNVSVAKGDAASVILTLQDRVNADFKKELAARYGDAIPEPTMIPLPGGRFIMGSNAGFSNVQPAHKVILSPFLMSATEVTFDQYDACVVSGGCDHSPADRGWGRGQRPVINVSWEDAQQYLAWLNQKTGKNYRLPTEAEWEYAARAGSPGGYSWGDEIGSNRANCKGCGSRWDDKQTAPVASFAANAFGLYDLHGNVREWCQDTYYGKYYLNSPLRDPQGLSSGLSHVVRGGGWFFSPKSLTSARRDWERPDERFGLGFRLVQSVNLPEDAKSPLYVGKEVHDPACSSGLTDKLEPMELWFETLAGGFIRGWLRSDEVVGSFSGASFDSLTVTWPTHGAEESLGKTSLRLVNDKETLRVVLAGEQPNAEVDPCHSGRMLFVLDATTDNYAPWVARTETDYLVKKSLSDARYWRQQKDLPQARSRYENALELTERRGWGQGLAAAEIMDPLAGLCFQMKSYPAAKEYARRALEIRSRLQGRAAPEVLVRTLRLASYHKQLQEYAEAKALLVPGLAVIETTPGKKGKKAFQELLAAVSTRLSAAETSQQQREAEGMYNLGHSALTLAIRHGEFAEAVRLIEASPDSSWPVVWKVFREIAEPGKKVTVWDAEEEIVFYPLLAAVAAMGNAEVAQALLNKGAQVNARLPDGSTALMFAAKMHHLEMVRLLLAAGADPDFMTHGRWQTNALEFALKLAESGEDERVALELLKPQPLKLKVAGITTSILQSAISGYSPLKVRVILETAAYRGLGQVVQRLAELGAPLQGRNQLGATLLHYALMGAGKGSHEVALQLIAQGADPNRYYATDQQLAAAKAKAFVPSDRRQGKTPLLLAIDEGASDEFIEQLLQLGADANQPSLAGVTPLVLAERKGRKPLAQLLVRYGAQR